MDVDVEVLQHRVDTFRLRHGIPGIAVRIRHRGKQIFERDSGFALLERRVCVTHETLFALGSITKQIVAAAALELQSQHYLDLDAPVCDILATGQLDDRLTVSHLLSHTSGVLYDVGRAEDPSPSLASVLGHVERDAAPPGVQWFYCNTNYYLAGHVLQSVAGANLSEIVEKVIPLDLREAFHFGAESSATLRASGHAGTNGRVGTVDPPDGRSFGSGSAYATAGMLSHWMERLWRGELLSAECLDLMMRRAVLSDGSETDYGLGCFSTRNGGVELSHDGNTAGFSSQAAYYPESELALCVLTNSQSHVAEALEKSLRDVLLDPLTPNSVIEPQVVQSCLADFEGCYGVGHQRTLVTLRGDGLGLTSPSGRTVELVRRTDSRFGEMGDIGYEYRFERRGNTRYLHVRRGSKVLASLPRAP